MPRTILLKTNELLTNAAGFSEADEGQVHDLQVRILIEKQQYKMAKQTIDTSAFLTTSGAAETLPTACEKHRLLPWTGGRSAPRLGKEI